MKGASSGLPGRPGRRLLLQRACGLWLALQWRPAAAASGPDSLQAVVQRWAGGRPLGEGRIAFEVAPLVENGNAVPVSVTVDSPMTAADHVQEIVIFNERNPQRDVARFTLTPACGRAQVDTRIRLATSQRLVALARLSDGSQWARHVDVIVTLAACVES